MDSSLSFPTEVDFFSNNNLKSSSSDDDSSSPPPPPEFKVNTGLTLLTINGDESLGEDAFGVYPNFKEKAKHGELLTEITVLRAKLEQMMGENHRLKDTLCKVNNDYKALKMHIDLMKPENQVLNKSPEEKKHREGNRGTLGPRQFIDLGLAYNNDGDQANNDKPSLSLSGKRSNGRSKSPVEVEYNAKIGSNDKEFNKEAKVEEEAEKNYSPPISVDDQLEANMRKARVAIRVRSEAPMITDGCQWRKYGQKKAKGNPCPRAYYRCTMTSGCPVKKQVQRCAEDRTILVTTYEGTHNHALPPAAMAMARTTAAAARMILSGSMSSNDALMNGSFLTKTTLLPCSSSNMATLSASAPFPTVTLDLTVPPAAATQQPCTQFQKPLSNNNGPHGFTQILAQALCSTNQSSFAGLQTNNNKDPLQLSAAIAADPNFTAALMAVITSIMGSTLPKNVNGDNNGNVTVGGGNRN